MEPILFLAQATPAAPAAAPATTGTATPILPPGAPQAPQPPSLMEMITPFIFMFAIFYFLLIRPQQKRQKEHEKLISAVKTGDKVVTNAGLHGLVANVKEKTIILKVAENVKLEFDKAAIATVTKASDDAAE
jgi:preprotein translocase subunit YajC